MGNEHKPNGLSLRPGMLSVSDTAMYLGISRSMLYQELSSGRFCIKPVKIGARTLFRVADLEAYIAAGCPNNWKRG